MRGNLSYVKICYKDIVIKQCAIDMIGNKSMSRTEEGMKKQTQHSFKIFVYEKSVSVQKSIEKMCSPIHGTQKLRSPQKINFNLFFTLYIYVKCI